MKDLKGRDRILQTAYAILMEKKDPDLVTVRQVAKGADVGIGLINYHFKSKDAMLMEAVGKNLAAVAGEWQKKALDETLDPKETLKKMLGQLVEMGAEQLYLIKIAARFELTEGDINTPLFILPFIQRITGKSIEVSKIIAFSMIAGLQSATLRQDQFKAYSGFDIEKREDRESYVDMMVDEFTGGRS